MSAFRAHYSGGLCAVGDTILRHDEVEYLPKTWPLDSLDFSTKSVLWHSRCAAQALIDGLCSVCHLLHAKPDGSCLL